MTAKNISQLKKVLALTLCFMAVEFIGGLYTNSLALISDAGHMLTDALAISLSLFAFYLSSLPATSQKSFGYYRIEILAAFINGVFLVILALGICWGAWQRLFEPVNVLSKEMFAIASVGLIFNLFGAWLLSQGDKDNPNMKGALFHVMADALGSIGAIIASALIFFFDWTAADSLVSFAIALIIIVSAFRLILDATNGILEGCPIHLNSDEIYEAISTTPHVTETHDLHVWGIGAGMVSLSVHVVSKDVKNHELLLTLRQMLKARFDIEHVTIQIEEESLRPSEPHI